MKKTAIAVAIAGALAAPALAQAQVQIGGGIHLIYASHDPDNGSAVQSGDTLHTSEPEIRFSGEENLGGGLAVWFQCASSFDVVGSQARTASAGFCGRNSAIGFKGGFGNLFAGTWDTPHKLNFNQVRGWWSGTNVFGGGGTLLFNGSGSNVVNTGNSFYRREGRSISYHSPNFGGFDFKGMYSSGDSQIALPESSPLSPRLISVGGNFKTGPFFIGASYEKHDDFLATPGTDTGWSVGAGYTIAGAVKLTAIYAQNEYEPTVTSTVESKGWALYLDWRLSGPHSIKGQYATVDSPEGTAGATAGSYVVSTTGNRGADVVGVAYEYALSKRTAVYGAYARMKNDSSTAAFTQGIAATTLGGSQTTLGVGLRHSF